MLYICLHISLNERMSLKQSTFCEMENSTLLFGLEPTISITYRVPWIFVMSQLIKTMHFKYITTYQWLQTKKFNAQITKIWIADVRWHPFWILRFVGRRCHFELGKWQKWIQHKKCIKKQQMKYFSSKMPTGLYVGLYFNFLSWLSSRYIILQLVQY